MPTWKQVSDEMAGAVSPIDGVRRSVMCGSYCRGLCCSSICSAFIRSGSMTGKNDGCLWIEAISWLWLCERHTSVLIEPLSLICSIEKMFVLCIHLSIPPVVIAITSSHSRHIHIDDLRNNGVNVTELEGLDNSKKGGCDDLHDCVLTVHHAYMNTFAKTPAVKIVENHTGNAVITSQLL